MKVWNREKMFMVLTAALLLAVSIQGLLLGKILWNQPDNGMQVTTSGRRPALWNPWTKPDVDFPSFGYAAGTNAWDLFAELDRMQQEMNRMFNHSFNQFQGFPDFDRFGTFPFAPDMDLMDAGDRYEVRLNIPGSELQDINVKVENQSLSITGMSSEEIGDKGANMLRQERRSGRFTRSLQLPGPVQEEEMEVKVENGVLLIILPKADE